MKSKKEITVFLRQKRKKTEYGVDHLVEVRGEPRKTGHIIWGYWSLYFFLSDKKWLKASTRKFDGATAVSLKKCVKKDCIVPTANYDAGGVPVEVCMKWLKENTGRIPKKFYIKEVL